MLKRAIANLVERRALAITRPDKKVNKPIQRGRCLLCCRLRKRLHAPKTEMICAGVDFPFSAGADDVARAILLIAKKRPAPMDSLLLVRFSRIKWRVWALRIARHSALVCKCPVVIRTIPIAAPFPHVSGHIE